MIMWTVTIPTVRTLTAGTQPARGSQTFAVRAHLLEQARELALAAAATGDAIRHRRGAALDTTAIEVARTDFLQRIC